MTAEEIRLRRLANQHLLSPSDCRSTAGELCGVQAQFLSNALHALAIRCGGADTGGLVKSWTLRGTVHVFPAEDLPLFLPHGRRRQLRPCDTLEGDEQVTAERKSYFAQIILGEICAGRDTREELKAVCHRYVRSLAELAADSAILPRNHRQKAAMEQPDCSACIKNSLCVL